MSVNYAILISLGICVVSAILEGLFAGKNIKTFFAKLQFPPYSAPLWVWSIIGVFYYFICFLILYRIFRYEGETIFKQIALTLILIMMLVNAFWNYLFFRLQSLSLSFIVGILYPFIDIALFICLLQFDKIAAWFLVPYFVYQIYGIYWGYWLWKLNSHLK